MNSPNRVESDLHQLSMHILMLQSVQLELLEVTQRLQKSIIEARRARKEINRHSA